MPGGWGLALGRGETGAICEIRPQRADITSKLAAGMGLIAEFQGAGTVNSAILVICYV